ncbi:MAG: Polyribonucleotide nucleotidyltransferase [candidate division WS6 bacterium GW2011_GWF2_39_15]|uniref:Polyribonucleotide nucleotidyltransferase n=1 Tax=candidate division WS6 bacterium GW2011_GWF2_39_15 TaxID=1619100 RepID=A0A0G0MYM5_9BACT|nr:MAG: Polyribonucleotide nucleotidyltransferase [candidate division WS6 bacterium GW2011_GWF2_39_15]
MLYNEKRVDFEVNGVKGFFSTGKIARKAHSAVMAGLGDTVILATVSIGEAMPESDFFPLSVEYVEKMAAAGMVSSSRFVKRERFPSDEAILRARMIDRSVRTFFPSDYRNEVLVLVEVLSFNPAYDPTILAINAVSAALLISKAPFTTPVSGVRVGFGEGDNFALMLNHVPRVDRDGEEPSVKLNLVIAGDGTNVTNLDADAFEVDETKVIGAMKYGLEQMDPWLKAQKQLVDECKPEKGEYVSFALPEELIRTAKAEFGDRIMQVLDISASEDPQFQKTLVNSSKEAKAIQEDMAKRFEGKYSKIQLKEAYEKVAKYVMRKLIKEEQRRLDGRKFDEIREMGSEVSVLPRVHGSGLFTRGLTQVLATVTLATIQKQQIVENMTGEDFRTYMHFYSQYPFTMGQAERYKYMPGRREIGHGALGEKAVIPVLPSVEEFPYTIIVSSDIMSENGSSSQATTSASTLALMDAGVPVKKHVAGIACGIVYDEDEPDDYAILTDIRDLEDFYGFMDFKVAGTRDGVTAVQFDTKAKGLPIEIFEKAIVQSKEARMKILDVMYDAIDKPREGVSELAPKVDKVKIPVSKIGELIGPGGKHIRELSETTNTEINVEEDGTVYIFAASKADMEKAKMQISGMAFVPEIGKVYTGTVEAIMPYGAFVEIARDVSGLVHVSEISDGFVKDVHEFINEGDQVEVKVVDIDDQGKIRLSMKAAKGNQDQKEKPEEK